MRDRVFLILTLCAALAAPVSAQTPPDAPSAASSAALPAAPPDLSALPGDGLIVQMHDAFERGHQAQLAALLPQVHGHPLEPWAAYWELKARLESATPDEMQAFFTRWAGTYQEDRLRAHWLLLAGRRREWAAFAAQYPLYRMRDDPQVACYAVAMSALQGQPLSAEAAAQVRHGWFAQRDLDDGCLLAASVLRQSGQFTDLDIWRRARVALQAGRPALARAAAQLTAPQADVDVAQIHNGALRYLNGRALASWPLAVRQQLAALALVKLAAQDPAQAAVQMGRWAGTLPEEARNWVWGAIGKEAALRLSSDALGYYGRVTRLADLNDDMLLWQARAALRQGQWQTVQTALGALHGPAAQEPAWVYWSARARLALAKDEADRQAARQDLARIAGADGFYPKLAQEELGGAAAAPPAPAPLTAQEQQAAANHPGLLRALRMIALELRPEGVYEWNYWTRLHEGGMNDRQLYAAADLACRQQAWDRCINTSERTRGFADMSQRFPMPYSDAMLAVARQTGIEPAILYGLIRQESRFIATARSSAGALGLMQLMPATARWMARKLALPNYAPAQLPDPAVNLLLGAGYLQLLLSDFQNSLPLAAAAYNAGPRRSRVWRGGPTLEGAIWVENIPFSETRDYVQKVLVNAINYAALLDGPPQSLKTRLGQIGPLPPGASDPSEGLP
jgi:soluble lytic murein transglycosylase